MFKSAFGSLIVLTGAITLLFSCSANEEAETTGATETFTEADLPHWVIEPETLIAETEDYMPGRIDNLRVMPDGSIIILDRTPVSIHQFDASGQWVKQVTREGSGPGELEQWSQLRHTPDGFAVSRMDGSIMMYEAGSDGSFGFARDMNIETEDRQVAFLRKLGADRLLYQRTLSISTMDVGNPDELLPEFRDVTFFVLDETGEVVQDSLIAIRQHSGIIDMGEGGSYIRIYSLPWRFSNSYTFTENGNIIKGDPETGKIITMNANGEEISRDVFRLERREVTAQDIRGALEDMEMPRELHRRAEARIRSHKPAFTRILTDDNNRLWLQTSRDNEDGFTYVVTDMSGNPLGQVELPVNHNLAAIQNGRLYIRYTPDDDLHEVRVASLNL